MASGFNRYTGCEVQPGRAGNEQEAAAALLGARYDKVGGVRAVDERHAEAVPPTACKGLRSVASNGGTASPMSPAGRGARREIPHPAPGPAARHG